MSGRNLAGPRVTLPVVLALVFALALLSIFLGYRVFRAQRADILAQRQEWLAEVADLKVRELVKWRQQRRNDIQVAAENPFLLDALAGLFPPAPDDARHVQFTELLDSFRRTTQYEAAAILEPSGKVAFSVGLDADGVRHPGDVLTAHAPIDQPVFTDFHSPSPDQRPHLGLYQPLGTRHLLYLQIDPAVELYPILQSWPTRSPSGEVLLVRREGDDVLFLNELRHRAGTALRLRIPIFKVTLPAARALTGFEGSLEGFDYRGVAVYAATRRVPETPWHIVAKIDRAEVLLPIQARGRDLAVIAAAGWLLATAVVLLAWRQQRMAHLHLQLTAAERHHQEIQRSAADLRASEERYRLLFSLSLDGIALHEMVFDGAGAAVDYRFLDVNPAFERLTGLGAATVVGRTLREVLPGAEPTWIETYAEVVRSGKPCHFEEFAAPLGKWFEVSAFPVGARGFAAAFSDITVRKTREDEQKRDVERLESICALADATDVNPQDLFAKTLERAIALTGSRYGYLYRYDEGQRLFTLSSWSRDVAPDCAVVESRTKYELEKTGLWGEAVRQRRPIVANDFAANDPLMTGCPAGLVALRNLLTIPVFSGAEIVAVLGVANKAGDYTEADVAQLKLLMSGIWRIVERAVTTEELARTVADLRRSNEELEQFAYIASHDLQEPLRSIASFLQLIERRYKESLDEDGIEFITFAVAGANRLQTMIEGLLAYSRIGRRPAALVPVDLGRALRRALANLDVAIAQAGAVVTSDPLPTLVGDEDRLVQLFQNLVGNAVKYRGDAPPQIHVSWAPDPGGLIVRVRDNGIGIAPEHQQRIFEIFRRLHGQDVPGAGIGLALCRRLVEHAGGRIWVESEPGRGSTFAFTLPGAVRNTDRDGPE